MRVCELRNLHLVTYENGMKMQQKLAEMRQRDEIADQLLLLEHPPVITLGRGGKIENLLASPDTLQRQGVRFFETTRGGDITTTDRARSSATRSFTSATATATCAST